LVIPDSEADPYDWGNEIPDSQDSIDFDLQPAHQAQFRTRMRILTIGKTKFPIPRMIFEDSKVAMTAIIEGDDVN
jgi:hypothetical protein